MSHQKEELFDTQATKYRITGPMTGVGESNVKGTVALSCPDEEGQTSRKITISNVLYVPSLRRKLISISKLCQKGVTVTMDATTLRVIHQNGSTVMLGRCNQAGLYELVEEEVKVNAVDTLPISEANQTGTNSADNAMLWHERLGHLYRPGDGGVARKPRACSYGK